MKTKIILSLTVCLFLTSGMLVAGCIICGSPVTGPSPTPASAGPTPMPVSPPSATATPLPPDRSSGATPLPSGGVIPAPSQAPGGNGSQPINATPSPIANPINSATLSGWGTDKDTYARGETATGWVDVKNTGNVPIDQIDFTVVIEKTVFFIPVSKTYSYSATGLGIQPGETKKVQFSQAIPAEYSGMSTAGNYKLTVTASLAGKNVGSYSKNIRVV